MELSFEVKAADAALALLASTVQLSFAVRAADAALALHSKTMQAAYINSSVEFCSIAQVRVRAS